MCEACETSKRRGVFLAAVRANQRLCDEHYRLTLALPAFPPTRAGQFVQLQCRNVSEQVTARELTWPQDRWPTLSQPELADKEPMLRRPFSLAGDRRTDEGVEIDVIYRTVGTGTHWLRGVQPGTELSILGPLGNGFPIAGALEGVQGRNSHGTSSAHPANPQSASSTGSGRAIRNPQSTAVVVGGGVGIPPMLYLTEALIAAGRRVIAISGARSRSLLPLTVSPATPPSPEPTPLPCIEEYNVRGARSIITTDDGSVGVRGFASTALAEWLQRSGTAADDVVVYCCGPEPLMRRVGDLCVGAGIECFLAMERHMACGMGTCQSCIVKIRSDAPQGWSFKLCCTDGPVFNARDVVWE